jgi:hypothetical protein
MLTATYELTPDDVAALAYYQAINDPGYRFSRRRQAVALAAIIALVGAVFAALQDTIQQAMVALGIAVCIASYYGWSRYRDYAAQFARYVASRYREPEVPRNLGPHRIQVSGEGITLTGDHFVSEMRWTMILKVECTETHIFAFTGPLSAVIVPRKSLRGAGFEEVRSALLRRGAAMLGGGPVLEDAEAMD